MPDVPVIINGGIPGIDEAKAHLAHVDGVMLGRAAYHYPYVLTDADALCFEGGAGMRSRAEIVAALLPYVETQLARGVHLRAITRHMLGLYHGLPGARTWRRMLSDASLLRDGGPDLLLAALREVEPAPVAAT
jgi:tRNA-dihydrouridine synthase A